MDYMFMTRPFWLELSISQKVVKDKFIEYLGTKRLEITSRKDASAYLLSITGKNGFTVKKRKCLLSGERLI